MLFDKEVEQDWDKLSTQTIFNYTPYTYSNKDYLDTYQKFKIATITTGNKLKLHHGVVSIDDKEVFTLGNKSIKGVLEQLEENLTVAVEWYQTSIGSETYEEILDKLPGSLLTDFSNYTSKSFEGNLSPYQLQPMQNNTIGAIESHQYATVMAGNKGIPFVKQDNHLFYEVQKDVHILVSEVSTKFYLYIDLAPKRFLDPVTVSHLLNYKKD